jgi:hypothetical protein
MTELWTRLLFWGHLYNINDKDTTNIVSLQMNVGFR